MNLPPAPHTTKLSSNTELLKNLYHIQYLSAIRSQHHQQARSGHLFRGRRFTGIRARAWRTLEGVFSIEHLRKGRSAGRLITLSAVGGVLVAAVALPAIGTIGIVARNAANKFE